MTGEPDIRCFVEDMNAYLTVSYGIHYQKTLIEREVLEVK